MKIKLLLTGVVAAAIVASSAVGSPSADKGKPNATGSGCKPRIAVILKGTLTGAGNPLTVKVAKADSRIWTSATSVAAITASSTRARNSWGIRARS